MRKSVEQVKSLKTIIQDYNVEYTETRKREIAFQRNISAFRQVSPPSLSVALCLTLSLSSAEDIRSSQRAQ
jgi:hypothetical protein